MSFRSLALCAVALAAGCHRPPTDGAATLEAIVASLSSDGLKVEGFGPGDARALHAARCQSGRIEGIDATLCEYQSDTALRLGHKAADEWIGSAPTGMALEYGRGVHVLLVLADRAHADPNGRAAARIAAAFRPSDGARARQSGVKNR